MDGPAQHAETEVEPVVHELPVPGHQAIEQGHLGGLATVEDALVEDEAEYEHQLVHHLQKDRESI